MAQHSIPQEPRYDVLWPLSRKAVKPTAAAPRIADLNDKTVAELWDVIFRGEEIYPLVREHIKSVFPRVKFVPHTAFGNFHGTREREVVASLHEKLLEHGADAAIVGIGA